MHGTEITEGNTRVDHAVVTRVHESQGFTNSSVLIKCS